ncbi:hypothetical protein BAE44_0023673 [Dichanthelium oligosanthes]|uniref:Uncharacterized protein n=1 Tax=Dichanthelium oligosanthes TaxID=888268 RepID=A0A1E5UQZ0_9POAL|nr:hypothetical protein BAE44_0023673 [Dichanthelium oligosanthes]
MPSSSVRRLGGHRNPSPSSRVSRLGSAAFRRPVGGVPKPADRQHPLRNRPGLRRLATLLNRRARSKWRRIDLTASDGDVWNKRLRTATGRMALERSAGQCEAFSGHDAGRFLCYVAARAPLLRSLHVRPFRRFNIYHHSAHLVSRVIA